MEINHSLNITTGSSEQALERTAERVDDVADSLEQAQEKADELGTSLDRAGSEASSAMDQVSTSAQRAGQEAARSLETLSESMERLGVKCNESSERFVRTLNDISGEGFDTSLLEQNVTELEAELAQLIEKYDQVAATPMVNNAQYVEMAKIKKQISEYADIIGATKTRIQQLKDEEAKRDVERKKHVNTDINVRTQMRELTNQLNKMRLAGEQDTEEFKKLEAELARLALAQRETTNAMRMDSTGATQWHGMIEGIQGLMGAYSAASGVMGLFTKDQEKLMEVQTKMQSTMSVLMGMQQLSNTLHSTSTFRMRTLTAAQNMLNGAMAAYNGWLKAIAVSHIKAGMAADVARKRMIALKVVTMGLGVAAVAALAVGITKLVKHLNEQKKATEEAKKTQEEYNSAISGAFEGKSVATLMELRERYNKLGDDMKAKKKFIDENKEAFRQLGVEVQTVSDLENLMVKNAGKYIEAQLAKAKADGARSVLAKKAAERAELQLKLDQTPEYDLKYMLAPGLNIKAEVVSNKEYKEIKDARDKVDEEMAGLVKDIIGFDDEYKKALEEGLFKTSSATTIKTGENAAESAEKAYESFVSNFQKAKEKYDEDNLQSEIDKIEYRKNLQLKALKESFEAVEAQMKAVGRDTSGLKMIYEEQAELIEKAAQNSAKAYTAQEMESLKRAASEYAGYFDRRRQIEEDYAREREKFFNADGTLKQGLEGMDSKAIDKNLRDKEENSLSEIDVLFASKSEQFQQWCNTIADASLDELDRLIEEAEIALYDIEYSSGDDSEKLAEARAKLLALRRARSRTGNYGEDDLTPGERSLKEWQALNETLNDSIEVFDEIGEAAGGAVAEIMSSATAIATSTTQIIGGIVTLTNDALWAEKKSAEGASDAMVAAEKASVILAIVGAAMKVIQKITEIVKGNKEANEAAANATDKYRGSVDKLKNSKALDALSNAFGIDQTSKMKEYGKQVDVLGAKLKSGLGDMSGIASDFRSGWQKFWGSDKNKISLNPSDYMTDGDFDGDKLAAWYEAYGEKLSEENKRIIETQLDQWEQYQDALEGITDYIGDLFGGVADDIADKMVDAFVESGDAAIDFADVASDMAQKVAKSWVKSMLMEQVFTKELEKKIQSKLTQGDTQSAIDAMSSAIEQAGNLAPQITEFLKGVNEITDITERDSTTKGIAQASQDSVDELNGRATAIQGHTFSIAENTKALVGQCASILDTLFRIDTNTERLHAIESDMRIMRSAVTDIRDRGVVTRL